MDRIWVAIFIHMDPPHGDVSPALKRIFKIRMYTDFPNELILHWGVGRKYPAEWTFPEEELWPERTKIFDAQKSVQSFFTMDKIEPGYKSILVEIRADALGIIGLNYVLLEPKTVLLLFSPIYRILGTTIIPQTIALVLLQLHLVQKE